VHGEGDATWVREPAKGDSTWRSALVAQLSQERAGLGAGRGASECPRWVCSQETAARRGPEQALLLIEAHIAPRFATQHKTSIVTNQL